MSRGRSHRAALRAQRLQLAEITTFPVSSDQTLPEEGAASRRVHLWVPIAHEGDLSPELVEAFRRDLFALWHRQEVVPVESIWVGSSVSGSQIGPFVPGTCPGDEIALGLLRLLLNAPAGKVPTSTDDLDPSRTHKNVHPLPKTSARR